MNPVSQQSPTCELGTGEVITLSVYPLRSWFIPTWPHSWIRYARSADLDRTYCGSCRGLVGLQQQQAQFGWENNQPIRNDLADRWRGCENSRFPPNRRSLDFPKQHPLHSYMLLDLQQHRRSTVTDMREKHDFWQVRTKPGADQYIFPSG
jgi:hypothetical protein